MDFTQLYPDICRFDKLILSDQIESIKFILSAWRKIRTWDYRCSPTFYEYNPASSLEWIEDMFIRRRHRLENEHLKPMLNNYIESLDEAKKICKENNAKETYCILWMLVALIELQKGKTNAETT